MERKAQNNNIVFFFIAIALIGIFLIGIYVISLIGPYFSYTMNQLSGTLNNLPQDDANVSQYVKTTAVPIVESSSAIVEWASYGLIIFMILITIGISIYARQHPLLLIPYFILIVVFSFVAVFIKDGYQQASTTITQSWTFHSVLMNNLPTIIILIGVISAVFMFILVLREPEAVL